MFLNIQDQKLNLEEKYLCLDFINTLDWRLSDKPQETLANYAGLLDWARQVGLLDAVETKALREKAGQEPEQAAAAFARAIDLRESAYQVIQAVIDGQPAAQDSLARLNQYVGPALAHTVLRAGADGFRLTWPDDRQDLDRLLGPIARSTVELLTGVDQERVKQCASEQGCGWLFIDTSRNRSRRWCSMESCGNRAKATSFYQRHSAGSK